MWQCGDATTTRRMLKGTEKSPPFKHSEGKKIPGLQGQSPYSIELEKKARQDSRAS